MRKIISCSLGLLMGLVPFAQGLEPLDWLSLSNGPLMIRPRATVQEAYNDNIFYRKRNREDDWITIVSPGLNLNLGMEGNQFISLDYQFDQYFYADNSSQDANVHSVSLGSRFERSQWKLEGQDTFGFLSTIIGGSQTSDELGSVKADRFEWDLSHTLTYSIQPETDVYLTGILNDLNFERKAPFFDRNLFEFLVGSSHKVSSKVRVLAEAFYGQSAIDDNAVKTSRPHMEFFGGYAGARFGLTDTLSLQTRLGVEHREIGRKDSTDPIGKVSLTQRVGKTTSLTASYGRRSYLSVQGAGVYQADIFGLDLRQRFLEKFLLSLGAGYHILDYDDLGRQDDRFRFQAALMYEWQEWLRTGVHYSHQGLDSDARGVPTYNVNQIALSLSIGY